MKKNKLRRLSLINLLTGYTCAFLFILLVLWNRPAEVVVAEKDEDNTEELFTTKTPPGKGCGRVEHGPLCDCHHAYKEFIYIDRPTPGVVVDRGVGIDRGVGVVLDDDPDVLVLDDPGVTIVDNPDAVVLRGNNHLTRGDFENKTHIGRHGGHGLHGDPTVALHGSHDGGDAIHHQFGKDLEGVVDIPAMEAAIKTAAQEENLKDKNYGVEEEAEVNLTLSKNHKGDFNYEPLEDSSPVAAGRAQKGNLYAYNYPSQGVGAGVGSPALGAGAGSAGLGAGIGEALLNGKAVPALGGVGTKGSALSPYGGVAGLVGGAGAGGAAGLTTALAQERLGLGIGVGNGNGGGGADYGERFIDLPPNGALHIMMHVDGSGSILNTRKQLEIMKDTLLKEALLPYYNNNPDLYERRVSIVDSSGERTLQFFKEASSKDNVLALAFQDEAQPVYHMPNFNRQPESGYLEDLGGLKASLKGHAGLYRGIMLQVGRGNTYAKSFKEFVENSWRGEGYLANHNLKKYYWEENKHHIDNKDGVIFSDVYHVKDEGTPDYYLNLLFKSAKAVGINLHSQGGGERDGVAVD